jgi:hypothetical protein
MQELKLRKENTTGEEEEEAKFECKVHSRHI